ncbi:4-hydroxy-tetrahydrodipicolinate reductase [Pseudoalteromonas ruthenica]|uniref:4-hydroxy-tetrahydrodipicolinate reductase n=1 Tax=Pseudoalteromonas ruthenica TaxID=151081 RepID=A0A5S3Z013_9GAMM|nr:4-hydroxy-tetrahydrodipicolinate reductase [Pseudoalteromonas ruthenica]TMP85612.1 4-hydroxy-tetrahydrodipicolinate reductase [Pseudoalteromonas ruthenica]
MSARVGVLGANGRMGQVLLAATNNDGDTQLAGAYVRAHSQLLGVNVNNVVKDLSEHAEGLAFSAFDEQSQCDVLIDFTLPAGMLAHLDIAVAKGTPMVIGTTGLDEQQMQRLYDASEHIPIVFARNFSVGINLLLNLVQTAAQKMGDDADIEVFEAHHRHKIDAPSGTALALGEAIAEAKQWQHDDVAVYDRSQSEQAKSQKEIGYSVLRGGDIVGEHTAYFALMGERLELTHKASSRMTFAQGAVRAAKWVQNKQPGFYTMQDVLEL